MKLPNEWNENLLIENRLQTCLPEDNFLCSYHQYSLGIGWKAPKRYQHPDHDVLIGKITPPKKMIPLQTLQSFYRTNQSLPIGSAFCFPQLKAKTELVNNRDYSQVTQIPENSNLPKDSEHTPETIDISDEITEEAPATGTSLCTALASSPLADQIKQIKITDLKESTKQKLRQKIERLQQKLEQRFAEVIAPGQSEDLLVLLQMYEDSDSLGKLVILSLVNHKKYIKEEIMDYFSCSKYQVDRARKRQAENSGLSFPQEQKQKRYCVSQEKVEHFLEFLISSALLQDVAYGVNKIKFHSGENQKVANAILTMKYSHIISYYMQLCQESLYSPLSDPSLWRILHGIKLSQRKALAHLDDVTAAGMNSFSVLSNVSENMNDRSIVKAIEEGKRYLKSLYPAKCTAELSFRTHSTSFAISDNSALDLMEQKCSVTDGECTE